MLGNASARRAKALAASAMSEQTIFNRVTCGMQKSRPNPTISGIVRQMRVTFGKYSGSLSMIATSALASAETLLYIIPSKFSSWLHARIRNWFTSSQSTNGIPLVRPRFVAGRRNGTSRSLGKKWTVRTSAGEVWGNRTRTRWTMRRRSSASRGLSSCAVVMRKHTSTDKSAESRARVLQEALKTSTHAAKDSHLKIGIRSCSTW
mmetsp:Transcript_101305/g.285659  ORF Transcript_101305/g.285659 Transcript_101305/m.285659 type:complete len:205 (+) Transcript_101305:1073-1687(+)